MVKIEIPKSKDKIKQQISALEWLLTKDNDKDKEIHYKALHELRKGLDKIEKR